MLRSIVVARPVLKVLLQRDLEFKGIPWCRQHILRKIKAGEFPPPDGKTSDAPLAPNFWFESTIDAYLRRRAAALREVQRASSATRSENSQPAHAADAGMGKRRQGGRQAPR
jgi:hypothetical protein